MKYLIFNGKDLFRINALVRRKVLINRLEAIEEFRGSFLDENDFNAANKLRIWGDEDWAELKDIEKALDLLMKDGPVTPEMMKEVHRQLEEI